MQLAFHTVSHPCSQSSMQLAFHAVNLLGNRSSKGFAFHAVSLRGSQPSMKLTFIIQRFFLRKKYLKNVFDFCGYRFRESLQYLNFECTKLLGKKGVFNTRSELQNIEFSELSRITLEKVFQIPPLCQCLKTEIFQNIKISRSTTCFLRNKKKAQKCYKIKPSESKEINKAQL